MITRIHLTSWAIHAAVRLLRVPATTATVRSCYREVKQVELTGTICDWSTKFGLLRFDIATALAR